MHPGSAVKHCAGYSFVLTFLTKIKRMKFITTLMAILLLVSAASAQQARTVTGTITDSKDGTPLAGVTVKEKGLNRATQSTKDGTYSIAVPAQGTTLVFSYVGYQDM